MLRVLPLLAAVFALLCPQGLTPVRAQTVVTAGTVDQAAIEQRRQLLFQRMLKRPGDLDAAFEYAMLSIKVNDLEAAVSTLERMLIFSPGLARVQLELGVLYYRLGAYASARAYLDAAASGPDVPQDVRDGVKLYLQQIDTLLDPPPASGNIFSGIRWQSNANSGPNSREVVLNGLTFTIDDESAGHEDWSVVNVGTLRLVHNLQHRQGDRLEAELTGYSARFFEQQEVNIEFGEALAGANFNMKRYGLDKSRLFVYGIVDGAQLHDDPYFSSLGFGSRLVSNAADRSTLALKVEQRYRNYYNSSERPTSSQRDGTQTQFSVNYAYQLRPNVVISTELNERREDTDADYYSNREFSGSAGVAVNFASPLRQHPKLAEPWLLQLGIGGILRRYDAPDPTINSVNKEKDTVYWSRAAVVVPVGEKWSVVPQVEYRDQSSNYDIYEYSNLTAMIGAQRRF